MDKQMSAAEVVAQLKDGMTIGIGGWGPRRKPMALVREILRSDLKDLTLVSYGGADVGMLCAAGKVKKVVFAFVSLDFIPLEPYFRQARQQGALKSPPGSGSSLHSSSTWYPGPGRRRRCTARCASSMADSVIALDAASVPATAMLPIGWRLSTQGLRSCGHHSGHQATSPDAVSTE